MADIKGNAQFKERFPGYGWWEQRSRSERKLGTICFVLLIVAISLLIVSIVSNVRLRNAEKELDSICKTQECIQAASALLDYVDPSVEPCDDFYHFACGNFLRKSVVPDDELGTSVMSIMQEDIYINLKELVETPISREDSEVTIKTKNLYTSCMNSSIEDGSADVLRGVLERIGGWPIADSKWSQRDLNLERRLAILFVHGIKPFVGGRVSRDDKNITDYILLLSGTSLILENEYYLNNSIPENEEFVESYKKMITSTARLLDADEGVIQKDVEDILRFEEEYAKISDENSKEIGARWERIETKTDYKRFTVAQLERAVPKIKWGNFLDYIFDYLKIKARKDDIIIKLQNHIYIRSLADLIRKTTPRTLANYLTWRFVYETMPYLDIHFRRLYYDFHKEVPLYSSNAFHFSRWRECIGIVSEIFKMPLTALYAKENFDEERKDEILHLIAFLKRGWIGGIYKQKWFDLPTRNFLEEKVNKLEAKIGFPSYVLQTDEMEKDYSELKISSDHFLDNMLKIKRHNVEIEMSVLTGKKDRRYIDPIEDPLTVNAFGGSVIVFPLAMLQSPVFVPRRPKYINYARFGMFVGHEIGHGFETSGVMYNLDRTFKQWPEEFIKKFTERAFCFAEQYSKFPIDMTDAYVNGNWTIDDNIADNSGLQNAYRAYKIYESENGKEARLPGVPYSTPQVFFIAYGQTFCELLTEKGSKKYLLDIHSPGKERVNVPMMNSKDFADAFNCPVGSPMNPEEKCNLWG